MATPPVNLYVRITGGFYPGSESSFGVPAINASGITPPSFAGQAYMVYPAGQGDLIWQGGVFGLTAPASGGLTANVWQIKVTVSHYCSNPSAFTAVTAQIYDTNTSTVLGSKAFTLSNTIITETITLTTGFTAADIPDLAVRLVWHKIAVGYVAVQHSYAEISYSYSDSIGSIEIDPTAVMPAAKVSVAPLPSVMLISQGAAALSFSPSFGKTTTAGNLLIAWVYSNSSSASFTTTCSDPSWSLAGHAGASFGWESLWYKLRCKHAETAPVFSDTAYSEPMSQLLEFSGLYALDQVAGNASTTNVTYTAASSDTASGDLIFGFCAFNGTNMGPTTLTISGSDSSGAALPLNISSNASSGGTTQYWITGWAQAAAPAGPALDTMTAGIGFFAGAGGLLASFKAYTPVTPVNVIYPGMMNRMITIPIRIGGGSR